MAQLQAGRYRARLVNYTISEAKTGNPQIEVLFEFDEGEGVHMATHQVRWFGSLAGKAVPITLKALHVMGYRGKTDADFAKIADGVEGGMLDLGKEVDLVLAEETTKEGKRFVKVAWVNDPDHAPGGFKNAIPREKVKVKIGALNLSAQMALVRKEMGEKAPVPAPTKFGSPTHVSASREPGEDDDLPPF